MDTHVPPLYNLPPELAHHVFKHLSKREKQQFALCCKHAHLCALAAIRSLILGHKCLSSGNSGKLKTMKYCTSVTLRPRTMDELTKLSAILLVHNLHRLPALVCLRLELLNVYDKQCDVSLILKSVVLHAKQLTELHVEQEAQVSLKGMAYTAELPMLERLSVKSRNGFEPGALGQLSRAVNVTSLHLEILPEPSGCAGPLSPSAPAGPGKSPSELARLQAADEVGLAKMSGQLQSFTAIGFITASGVRPVTALLAAAAGSPKPRLAELHLGDQEVPSQSVELIASITSLHTLRLLPGCELSSALELSRLSSLGSLTQLVVAPLMPPAPVLAAWAKGCRQLSKLGVCGQPGPLPLTAAMPGITELQLLGSGSSHSRRGSSAGHVAGTAGRLSMDLGSLAITLRSPLSLSGLESLWPRLASLEVVGWALDSGSMAAIKQLEGLSSIRLQGGRDPGTALSARLALQLLDKPGLRKLVLLEASDLDDAWVSEAMTTITGRCSDGSLPTVRELHLGAPGAIPPASSTNNSTNGSISCTTAGPPAPPAGTSIIDPAGLGSNDSCGSGMLTDKGIVKLCAWPHLTTLVLVGLPGVTLAGLKALVGGCASLGEVVVRGCPAVSAAPADSISKAAVGVGGRAVHLWVS